jgi:hypothetical protein
MSRTLRFEHPASMKTPRPNRSKLQRAMKRRDKLRRNFCRRCPFSASGGRCLDTTIRSGRCGDWVFYRLPGGKQCRRRWVRPKDPLTSAQVQNRTRLAAASHKYSSGLTKQERDACITVGAKVQSRNRLGQSGPLTGQQYSVRSQYKSNARAKAQNTGIPAQVLKPQRLTRPSWEPLHGRPIVPPDRHLSGRRVTGRGYKPRATPRVPKLPAVTRFTPTRGRRMNSLSSIKWRRGQGRGGTFGSKPVRASVK